MHWSGSWTLRQVARIRGDEEGVPLNSMKRSGSRAERVTRGTRRDLFERQIFCHQTSVSRGISVSICAGLIQSVSRAFAKIGSRAHHPPQDSRLPSKIDFSSSSSRIRVQKKREDGRVTGDKRGSVFSSCKVRVVNIVKLSLRTFDFSFFPSWQNR